MVLCGKELQNPWSQGQGEKQKESKIDIFFIVESMKATTITFWHKSIMWQGASEHTFYGELHPRSRSRSY